MTVLLNSKAVMTCEVVLGMEEVTGFSKGKDYSLYVGCYREWSQGKLSYCVSEVENLETDFAKNTAIDVTWGSLKPI